MYHGLGCVQVLSLIPVLLLFNLTKISFLLFRCLLLLAAGSSGCRGTSDSLPPFRAGPVNLITSRLLDSCPVRVKKLRCHDSCVLPAAFHQSCSKTPQGQHGDTCGLNSLKLVERIPDLSVHRCPSVVEWISQSTGGTQCTLVQEHCWVTWNKLNKEKLTNM